MKKCLFSWQCEITPFTKAKCPGCRLQKCLSVGMSHNCIYLKEKIYL